MRHPLTRTYARTFRRCAERCPALLCRVAFASVVLFLYLIDEGVAAAAGAVLTAYVGVTGLVRRMSMDQCLPKFFLVTNKLRGTNHFIILTFFGVSTSLLVLLNGNVDSLSGVYTVAFLSVMVRVARVGLCSVAVLM